MNIVRILEALRTVPPEVLPMKVDSVAEFMDIARRYLGKNDMDYLTRNVENVWQVNFLIDTMKNSEREKEYTAQDSITNVQLRLSELLREHSLVAKENVEEAKKIKEEILRLCTPLINFLVNKYIDKTDFLTADDLKQHAMIACLRLIDNHRADGSQSSPLLYFSFELKKVLSRLVSSPRMAFLLDKENVISLEDPIYRNEKGDDDLKYTDVLPSNLPTPESECEFYLLQEVLASLPTRDEYILRRRFLYGDSLEELGQKLNLTRERIRQIEESTILKLRRMLTTKPIKKVTVDKKNNLTSDPLNDYQLDQTNTRMNKLRN